jgi:hypothetical protein
MVERYPHTIILAKTFDHVKDGDGYFSLGTSTPESITIQCRIVQMGAGPGRSMVGNSEMGDVIVPSFTVSLPLIEGDYSKGTVTWNEVQYNIIKFYKYQARCKIWI